MVSTSFRDNPGGRKPLDGQAGMSLVELMISVGVLMALMSVVFQSFADLTQSTARESTQSYATSKARGAMERLALSFRNDLVHFNMVPDTPLGINFDLDDDDGNPFLRDGMLYYFDRNHTAQFFKAGATGEAQTTGLDDQNGDGFADVIGVGLVRQDLNEDGVQDFIDLNRDGQPDDLDGDGHQDPLWTLALVQFNSINDVTDPNLWRQGLVLATNLYIRRIDPAGPLTGNNIATFEFSAHNPLAMLYDTAAYGGNGNGIVDEPELGRMTTADDEINAANEVASIDSITITLHVAEIANRRLVSGDISSDLITPRPLQLMKSNGMVGIPDPTRAANIN
jgi:type II secretory pathway pseudopilin PulG